MSSKSSLFLTGDNEHCYEECNEPHYVEFIDQDDKFMGYNIYLEMSKRNIDFWEDDEDITICVRPGSELYNHILKMK